MKTLIIIALIVIVIVAVIAIMRRMKQQKQQMQALEQESRNDAYEREQQQAAERRQNACPLELEIGSTVEYQNTWYTVGGIASYKEGKWTWTDYRFVDIDHNKKSWLTVEKEDGEWSVTLWHDIPRTDAMLPQKPYGKSFTYQGETYRRVDDGEAGYDVTGKTDLEDSSGTVEYVDYESPSGKLVSYERYDGDEWEACTGIVCNLADVHAYPPRDKL